MAYEISIGDADGQPVEHEGEKYLRLLGLEGLANQQIAGRTEQVRDFLDVCGHARPLLVGFENLERSDPAYDQMRDGLRGFILHFAGVQIPQAG
jgi:hypothetical protein